MSGRVEACSGMHFLRHGSCAMSAPLTRMHCVFSFLQDGKVKNTPWGSSFKAPPSILHGAPSRLPPLPKREHMATSQWRSCMPHMLLTSVGIKYYMNISAAPICVAWLRAGYSAPVTGATAQERLDMRAAMKSDKFCK